MTRINIGRRRFVGGLRWALGIAMLPGMARTAASSISESRILVLLARRLFPHRALSNQPYLSAATTFVQRAEKSADLAKLLKSGIASLQKISAGDWPAQAEPKQIAAMKAIEATAFFASLRFHVLMSIYQNREVWKQIGYEGSSFEQGGYINRGFDDIDWLPED